VKIVIALAVVIGIVFGIGSARFVSIPDDSNNQNSFITTSDGDMDSKRDLPSDVLKALPAKELAEIFPEKAEFILVPNSVNQIKRTGNTSDDPEYLRTMLTKMGANPSADATTKQLQDMLAQVSNNINTTSK
jgi:hypothetical protein